METRLLECFVCVCKTLNFTKAAEMLNISQPALSRDIRILESNLGTQLFHRIGKRIVLTQAGEILLHHANRIFSEMHAARMAIEELNNSQIGRITIGNAGNYVLHNAISLFHKQYPEIEISLMEVSTKEIISNVIHRQFDLGCVFLPVEESRLECKSLFKGRFSLVISANHELANKPMITMEELQSIPLILPPKTYFVRQYLDKIFQKAGAAINPVMESTDRQTLVQMTILNEGATIISDSYLDEIDDDRVRQIPLYNLIPAKDIGLIFRKDDCMPPPVRTFVSFLLKHYQEDGDAPCNRLNALSAG